MQSYGRTVFKRAYLSSSLPGTHTGFSNYPRYLSYLRPKDPAAWAAGHAPSRRTPLVTRQPFRIQSRLKANSASRKETKEVSELFGDEPPLFDGKPRIWARWVYALLLLDVLFTGFSVDMVMNQWTEKVEKQPSRSTETSASTGDKEHEFVLRPLWQRLGLSTFEAVVGIGAAALILASRDRTVWRLRALRVPLSSLPPGKGGIRPQAPSNVSQNANASANDNHNIVTLLALETASGGRQRRFLLHDCTLVPGRNLSELYLNVPSIRGHFIVNMNRARVLGLRAAEVNPQNDLRGLLDRRLESDIQAINASVDSAQTPPPELLELRKMLVRAWISLGGSLTVQRDYGWTDGPAAR